jgi:hypothetical protein
VCPVADLSVFSPRSDDAIVVVQGKESKMKGTMSLAATLLAIALTLSVSAAVAEQGGGQVKKPAKVAKAAKKDAKHGEDDGLVFDRAGHVRAIHDYVRAGFVPSPPGLKSRPTKKGWIGVPGDLVARMPPMPPYYHRYFAGADLIVVDTRNNTIAFLIRGVLR